MHKFCMLVLVACAASAAAQAQESDTESEDKNYIELFVGITHDSGEGEPSLGLLYERRFGRFGTGFIAEFTKAAERDSVAALPFFWHPTDRWRTVVAIGTEYDDGENSFLTRVGGSYEFEFSGWSLAPEVNVDFVEGGAVLVFGASFVWKF